MPQIHRVAARILQIAVDNNEKRTWIKIECRTPHQIRKRGTAGRAANRGKFWFDGANTLRLDGCLIHEGGVKCADFAFRIARNEWHGPGRVVEYCVQMRVDPIRHVRAARDHRLIGGDHRARKIGAVGVLEEVIARLGRRIARREIQPEWRIDGRVVARLRGCDHRREGRTDAGRTDKPVTFVSLCHLRTRRPDR